MTSGLGRSRPKVPPPRPTALSGALVAAASLLVVMAMLTANRWLVLGAAALVGLLVTAQLSRPNLAAVRICLSSVHRARAGEHFSVQLHVHNDGRRVLAPARLRLRLAGTTEELVVDVDAVAPGGTARAQVPALAVRRGVYARSLALAEVGDPLGIIRSTRGWATDHELLVHPAQARPAQPALSAAQTDAASRAAISGTHELAGLRPWRQGEDRRAVHWRASARRRQLVVVERDVPDLPTRWVLALAGTPGSDIDEAALAVAAATWLDQLARGHEVHVLAWTPDGSLVARPDATPTNVLDWFARLPALGVPRQHVVLDALPPRTDAMTALPLATAPADWAPELTAMAARQGVRVAYGFGSTR